MVELAGYTSRVVDMLNVFKDVQNGRFEQLSANLVDYTLVRYERQNVASPPVRSKVLANQNEVNKGSSVDLLVLLTFYM